MVVPLQYILHPNYSAFKPIYKIYKFQEEIQAERERERNHSSELIEI